MHILVAEDIRVNQKVVQRMLESRGCRVDLVANGAEAVAATQDRQYALVLMDCQMPELDGLDATAAIRRRDAGSGRYLPIVALTADVTEGARQRCLDAGMDGYLSKPLRPRELEAALLRWLPDSFS